MKFAALVSAIAFAATAHAHTRVWSVWVNNQDQGDGRDQYIQSPPSNFPVKDVNSQAIRCNVAERSVPRWVNANAGDTISFEWYHEYRGDQIIDASHVGPTLVYISPANDRQQWTKIHEDGLSNGQWAIIKAKNNRGRFDARIPSSLAPGDYIFRAEMIALHEGDANYQQNPIRGAQFYPSCIQIRVGGSGSTRPPGGVTFPGTYRASDPGIHFNPYPPCRGCPGPSSYPIPGGPVWHG